MTRFRLTALFLSLFFLHTLGQSNDESRNKMAFYSDSFQSYMGNNIDSSLYFIRMIAANPRYSANLKDCLHNRFAVLFGKIYEGSTIGITAYKILEVMVADSNEKLVNSAKPLYYWAKIQRSENDNNELVKLTNAFIKSELSKDIYNNRAGRYALLIYQVIFQKKELNELAERLLSTTIKKIKFNLSNPDSLPEPLLRKKIWFKYLYASANSIKADNYMKLHQEKREGEYYKIASEYSPDISDKQYIEEYSFDKYLFTMYFRPQKLEHYIYTDDYFWDDYLSFLTKHSKNNKEVLATLLSMAIADPKYKEKLKSFYELNYPEQESFSSFWTKSINKNLKPVIDFSLKQMDGQVFATKDISGKWALIDFWGTWCGPCRAEHPDLQKLYQAFMSKDTVNFIFLTIACYDDESKVKSYVKENNYNFPVAMADTKIVKLYSVTSFPSKVLITPQGKYLIVPFGIDWVNFIKQYTNL